MKINICPDCGSGYLRWCGISVRPYCGDCGKWGRVNFGTPDNAIKEWNELSIKNHGGEFPCGLLVGGMIHYLDIITKASKMINLVDTIQYFIAPDCYEMMKKVNINRVTIFNQACREAFKLNNQTVHAEALRRFAIVLDETGILPETLED